ncbi:ATP-binding protein, partial [Klebsiella pneumoniae]|nr:ATP-binding protein [Klebsiella pneumoniae]
MQMSQLVPASQLTRRYGVKSVVFGGPGAGKTPLMQTAPRPVLLVTEPGMLSMRGSNIPCWEAPTPARINEFFEWL